MKYIQNMQNVIQNGQSEN